MGSRGAAAIVDTALQALTLMVVFAGVSAAAAFGASPIGLSLPTGRAGATIVVAVVVLAIFIVTSGYFILWEILWNGQTPGKRLVGVRVIRENGYPLRPLDAIIRNLVRIVDWLPLFYGLGVLTMLLNRRSRRLGDFASGTIVVRERSASGPTAFSPPPASARGYSLSNADATLVRDFLHRRSSMSAQARTDLARRLATAMAERYSLPFGDDAERFLESLNL